MPRGGKKGQDPGTGKGGGVCKSRNQNGSNSKQIDDLKKLIGTLENDTK